MDEECVVEEHVLRPGHGLLLHVSHCAHLRENLEPQALGFRVQRLGFRVQGARFRVWV